MRLIGRVAATGALLLSVGCGSNPSPAEQMTPPTLPPTTTSTPSADPSEDSVIGYGNGGIFIQSAADTRKLEDIPEDFKAFIASTASKLKRPAGTQCAVGVTVEAYDPAGFARGAINECGGYNALWGKQNGAWKELIGTQDAWHCDELKKFDVPASGLITECADPSTQKVVTYTG